MSLTMLFCIAAKAQTSPTAQTLPYTQNFSGLSATSTTYPMGWQGWTITTVPSSAYSTSTPSADRTLVASSTASVNSGNVHNYDGKIGFLNTSSLDLGLILAINTTDKKNIELQYDIMTIRNPYDTASNTRINEVTVQYRLGTTGSFTTLTGTEYQNNTVKQITSVTTPQKLESKTILLPSDCDSESVVQIRWLSKQVSGSGSRPSFAIDNIDIDTAAPVSNELNIVTTTNALEGLSPSSGMFTLTFTPATGSSTTFNYTLGGSAILSTDYSISLSSSATPSTLTALSGTITVPSGVSSFTATVNPINDVLSEGLETVRMAISSVSGLYSIKDSVATMNLLDDESTPISSIQGTGMTAKSGSYTVEAIVTGVFPTLSPAGFYIQEEDADADSDPKTSEGIFVVSSSVVSIGDKVKVSGTVLESSASPSFNQAIINATSVSVLSSASTMPTVSLIKLPLLDTNDFERYEGMLVRFIDTLTVTDNFNLGRFGELGLSVGGVLYQPTQEVDVNDVLASGTTSSGTSNLSAVNARVLENRLRFITLDDGRASIPTLPYVNADSTVRIASTLDSLWGIMGYAFSKYRIQPVSLSSVKIKYASRPSLPSVGSGANLRVASFNVLNYFNGDGVGGGYPTARGAHSAAEFTRQRDKIISAIKEINADVVGLIEIENDGVLSNSAIQDLVNGLNIAMGSGTYSIINDGATIQTSCTDAIRCGIIYKSSVVTPIGAPLISAHAVFNRPPLSQQFKLKSTDSSFNFIINHFKSKSCSGSTGADVDQLDGQGCYNTTRKAQAGALLDFIKNIVVPNTGIVNVLSMGDYNAYFEEDPLDSIRSNGYTVLSSAKSYSYLFGSMMGSLDNAFVNSSLNPAVTGIVKWNINSCEPTHLGYDDLINDGSGDFSNPWAGSYTPTPFRSSDHDPIIIGLNLPKRLSVAEFENQIFKLYPNPATDKLVIECEEASEVTIVLMNSMGQQLMRTEMLIGKTQHELDIQKLHSGIYFVKIISANGESSVKPFCKR